MILSNMIGTIREIVFKMIREPEMHFYVTLVSLQPRINLSPFTKDFRGEEHYNESIDLFFIVPLPGTSYEIKKHQKNAYFQIFCTLLCVSYRPVLRFVPYRTSHLSS